MASYFLDSCAIAKRYAPDRGTTFVQRLCAAARTGNDDLFISQVARVEVVRALSARARGPHRHRNQRIAARDRAIAQFMAHCDPNGGDYDVIDVTPVIIERAANLCKVSSIKSFDAVQLASAEIVRDFARIAREPDPVFVTADDKLAGYARDQGFDVRDPEDFPDPSELTQPTRMSTAVPPSTPPTWHALFEMLGRLLSGR